MRPKKESIYICLENLADWLDVNTKAEIQILCCLWKYSTYVDDNNKGNCVFISKMLIADIQNVTTLKEQTIRNIISSLSKKKLLIKDTRFRGTYYLNPIYFFKGPLKERPKTTNFILSYIRVDKPETDFDRK